MVSSENHVLDFSTEDLPKRFQWPEYVVFSAMLLISAGIGVFYGCFGTKQKTTSEFLMADRNMRTLPMCMSLIASFVSAIMLLGTPVEMYRFGTQYWVIGFTFFLVMVSAAYLYLPVFYELRLISAYEYLELRFDKSVRLLASSIFMFQMTIYMAIVVYAPALALNHVTGMSVYGVVVGIFVVCIFYTALGGIKAVMWTDTFQGILMFASMLIVVIKGAINAGGISTVWESAVNGSRIEVLNVDFDPRVRYSIWSLLIGGYFSWIAVYGTNQTQIQRYLTVPTIKKAQGAIWFNAIGLFTLLSICCYAGLVIYATYAKCDPIVANRIEAPDQLFPLFVMDTLGGFPGLPGLFVAGIFSGSLSTVSSGLNSLAAIFLEDFVKGVFNPNITEDGATKLSKMLSLAFGITSFLLVFVAAQFDSVLQASISIFGITGGPLMGIFTLGMFFPWANVKGALFGTLSSMAFVCWLGFGANIEIQRGNLVVPKLPVDVTGCPGNVTLPRTNLGNAGGLLEFYRIAPMWYSAIGGILTIGIGLIVSFLTKPQDPHELDPRLISPPINRFVCWLIPDFRRKLGWEVGKIFEKEDQASIAEANVQESFRIKGRNDAETAKPIAYKA